MKDDKEKKRQYFKEYYRKNKEKYKIRYAKTIHAYECSYCKNPVKAIMMGRKPLKMKRTLKCPFCGAEMLISETKTIMIDRITWRKIC